MSTKINVSSPGANVQVGDFVAFIYPMDPANDIGIGVGSMEGYRHYRTPLTVTSTHDYGDSYVKCRSAFGEPDFTYHRDSIAPLTLEDIRWFQSIRPTLVEENYA